MRCLCLAGRSECIAAYALMIVVILAWLIVVSFAIAHSDWCDDQFAVNLPKLELHAHLHGSIRSNTLVELVKSKPSLESKLNSYLFGKRDIAKCFGIFDIIHEVIDSSFVLERLTKEVLLDYRLDNVIYLELRTAPRLLADGTTEIEYIDKLCDMIAFNNAVHGSTMITRLLLSIDRSLGAVEGQKLMNIFISAHENYKDIIVGVDFSGNPHKDLFENYLPLFELARGKGLRTTLHGGELLGSNVDNEFDSIMNFMPERIGHALHLTTLQIEQMLQRNAHGPHESMPVPAVEICPSSNLQTLGLDTHLDHPTLAIWLDNQYPFSINTDDSGVFNTSLSTEYAIVRETLQLSHENMLQISANVIHQIFATDQQQQVTRLHSDRADSLRLWMKDNNCAWSLDQSVTI